MVFLNFVCWREVFALQQKQYLMVNFLDVGQGDSAFIETPQGHQIIIDGGPTSAVLGKIAKLLPFWDRTIDLIILSHPERDHMSGLLDVLKIYKADYILWSGVKKISPEYEEWLDVLEKQKQLGAKIIIAQAEQKIIMGNVFMENFYPFEGLEEKEVKSSANDTSLVNGLFYGKSSFLFTGDIGFPAENLLIDSYELANFGFDVLKVAHHGSKYSTSDLFLEAVKPQVAIIEVGKNSYGHPTPEVLQGLEKFGINVLRTDELGDIIILSDGEKIIINAQ